MDDKGRVFARFKDDKPAASDRRDILSIPRRGSAMSRRAVEVVHVRSNGAPTGNGTRQGDLAHAALASSKRFIELDAVAWSNNVVRVMARNISTATFDLAAATLSVRVAKRRVQ